MHSVHLLAAVAALPLLGADALKSSTTARCGIQSGDKLTCKGSVFGNCCSKSGYCGSTSAYCGTGCQAGFGDCKSSKPTTVKASSTSVKSSLSTKVIIVSTTAPASSELPTSPAVSTASIVLSSSSTSEVLSTSVSVADVSTDAVSSSAPSSSAPATWASSTQDVQLTKDAVSSSTPSAPAASSTSASKVSTDGSCGGAQGFTCSGSTFGNCCSEYGWCGNTAIYCDAGCNSAFGTCNGASSSAQPTSTPIPEPASSTIAPSSFTTLTRTSSAAPIPTQGVSTDGSCGANTLTCLGSTFGNCCSQYGYCGSSSGHCGTGCQSGFGDCDAPSAPGTICNVEGFANKAEYYASSYNLVDATDVSTCAALCLAEDGCNSYLFNPEPQNCAYLKQSLSEGEFIATAGTNQFFWDRACAAATTA